MSESVHRRAFDAFASRAQDRLGESLRRVTLFGSVARGEGRSISDIDVLAVGESPEAKQPLHDLAFDIEIEYGVVVSLLVRTPAEYDAMEGTQLDRELERGVTVG